MTSMWRPNETSPTYTKPNCVIRSRGLRNSVTSSTAARYADSWPIYTPISLTRALLNAAPASCIQKPTLDGSSIRLASYWVLFRYYRHHYVYEKRRIHISVNPYTEISALDCLRTTGTQLLTAREGSDDWYIYGWHTDIHTPMSIIYNHMVSTREDEGRTIAITQNERVCAFSGSRRVINHRFSLVTAVWVKVVCWNWIPAVCSSSTPTQTVARDYRESMIMTRRLRSRAGTGKLELANQYRSYLIKIHSHEQASGGPVVTRCEMCAMNNNMFKMAAGRIFSFAAKVTERQR